MIFRDNNAGGFLQHTPIHPVRPRCVAVLIGCKSIEWPVKIPGTWHFTVLEAVIELFDKGYEIRG
jgi:hypothetical protein